MAAKMLQLNFVLTVPAAEWERIADSIAPQFAEVPGLLWKIWSHNPAEGEVAGFYLFESEAALQAFLDGPLPAQVVAAPWKRELTVKQFDVMPRVTALTRGPVPRSTPMAMEIPPIPAS